MTSQDTDRSKLERGLATIEKLVGKRYRAAYEARIDAGGLDADLASLAVEFAFSDAWARPGLGLRERSLVVISLMIAMRQTAELKSHFHLGLKNGLTPEELGEVLIQVVPYIGLAPMHHAYDTLKEVLAERNQAAPSPPAHGEG